MYELPISVEVSHNEKLRLQRNLEDGQWYVYHLSGQDYETVKTLHGPDSHRAGLDFISAWLSARYS